MIFRGADNGRRLLDDLVVGVGAPEDKGFQGQSIHVLLGDVLRELNMANTLPLCRGELEGLPYLFGDLFGTLNLARALCQRPEHIEDINNLEIRLPVLPDAFLPRFRVPNRSPK